MKPTAIPTSLALRICALIVAMIIIGAVAAPGLSAKSTTWTHGSSVNDLWSNPDNWSNGVPEDFDDVHFSAIGGTSTLDLSPLILNELDMTGYTGILDATEAALQAAGDITTSGVFEAGNASLAVGADLVIGGTMNAAGAAISVAGRVRIHGELDCHPGGSLEVGGNITGSAGSILNMGSGYLNLYGDGLLADFASVSWSEGGSLRCSGGPGTQQIALGSSAATLHDVTISRATAADTTRIDHSGALTIGGNLAVSKGVLRPTAGDVEFGGTVTVRGGFDYAEPGGILRFTAGFAGLVDVGLGGIFRIAGTSESRVRLRQDGVAGGEQWILTHDATSSITVDGAEVQDSDAEGPAPVPATNSADKGNNTNWDFIGPKTTTWIAESSTSTNWSDPLNWDLGSPESGDAVVFDTLGGTSTMDIYGLILASLDMDLYLGELVLMNSLSLAGDMTTSGMVTLNGNSVRVGGSLEVHGTVTASGSSISVGADLNLYGQFNCDPGGTVDVQGDVEAFESVILNMGSSVLRVGGDLLLSAPSAVAFLAIDHLDCAGAAPLQTISLPILPVIAELNDVTVERESNGLVTQFRSPGGEIGIAGALNILTGVFEAAQGNLTVGGATSIHADGGLRVESAGAITTFEGPVSVNGTLIYERAGGYLRFAAGEGGRVDVTNGGTFAVVGTPTDPVHLEQDGTAGDGQWILLFDGTSTISIDFVELQDGWAQGSPLAAATNSLDMGNNLNWYFGTVSGSDAPPLRLSLEIAPNPFNPATTLRYAVPRSGEASLRIYDVTGRLIRELVSGYHAAGDYRAIWNGRNDAGRPVGSAAYLCRMESNGETVVRKLLLLR